MPSVLIVDDDEQFSSGLAELLRLKGNEVRTAADLESARQAAAQKVPQLLLLDLMLPDGSGLELLSEFESRGPERVALMTGHTAVKSFVSSVAGPGMSYLTKPVEPREVLNLLDSIDDAGEEAGPLHFGLIVGESSVMQQVYEQIERVAPSDSTVFVEGQSGTGKELVAEGIHRASGRKGKFVPVNCGGLTAELVASELFGHEKGSFTGAGRQHAGYFERAADGTLFLDEITEMPIEIQTQLLRVLETRTFARVGGEKEIDCTARLVAATNRDPAEAVREGHLREDLYFRLQVFPIVLPPLRNRADDIQLLAQYFLAELNRRNNSAKVFDENFFSQLENYEWPGNVRELKHLVSRAYIMSADDRLEAPATLDQPLSGGSSPSVGQSIRDVERQLIMATLEHYDGDKKATAATLGVSLKTLYNRLKDYGETF